MKKIILVLMLGVLAATAGVTVKQGEKFWVNTEFNKPTEENVQLIEWTQSWDSSLYNLANIAKAYNIYVQDMTFPDETTKGIKVQWVNSKDIKDGGFYALGFLANEAGTYDFPEPTNVRVLDQNGVELPSEIFKDLGVQVEPRATTELMFRTSLTPPSDLDDNNVVTKE